MDDSPLNDALRHFEAAEANLVKSEKVLGEIEAEIPPDIAFISDNVGYENNCRFFEELVASLPPIDGWKPEITLFELNDIAQMRLDAREVGESECILHVERLISDPIRQLREYRHRFNQARRRLIRESLEGLIDQIDGRLRKLSELVSGDYSPSDDIRDDGFSMLKEDISQITTLLGSSVGKPPRWSDLLRHLHFGLCGDLRDILDHDWPSVRAGLRGSLYGEKEPVPVQVDDLGTLVGTKPSGQVATRLKWESLSDDEFERVVFSLISDAPGYENPEWLMKTNAPDRGRDLSVYRVIADALGGTIRHRVIIQCKHWLSKSIGPTEIAVLKEQMRLWEPPRVDIHVIATSGRFTSDAVSMIESHNQSDTAMSIEMWPESHLERLLAARPALIAQFSLR